MSKKCSKCGKILDESEFNWKIRNIRRAVHCKNCSRKYIREHYKNNLRYYIEKAKKRNIDVAQRCHEYIGLYLSSHPCVDCGEKDILVLEFDHKNKTEKEIDISKTIRQGFPVKKLIKEISKCEIRCANCHRRKTAHENNNWKLKFAPVA